MTENLNTNVRNARSDSTDNEHLFPWKWRLSDLQNVPKNGKKVFSCFSCGGGSSMGYKLAGYELIGNCEIDRAMAKVYNINHHPKYSYNMDVREFLAIENEKLPEELLNLDILDGSPPCSTFSMAGKREAGWGVEKQFREGQKLQTLDDLFFVFINIAKKLQPKAVVAENVRGLMNGNAKGYVNEIFKAFKEAGYRPQMFLLNAGSMGVPQARERVFFVASRQDLNFEKIKLSFNEPPIVFGKVRSKEGKPLNPETQAYKLLQHRIKTDKKISDINLRLYKKNSRFNGGIVHDNRVCQTITSGGEYYRFCDAAHLSKQDIVSVSTFPQDYDFVDQPHQYVCGMSVPPVMMAQIAHQIDNQWFKNEV